MDVEKTIEFLLSQQAQLFAGLQEMREVQSRQQELVTQLIGIMSQQATGLDRLTEAHRKTEANLQTLTEKVDGLADNLNALIKVVDDLVRRDGQRPS